jgi:hypothetical protein
MEAFKVNPLVGNVRNNGPEMLVLPVPTGGPELNSV